MGDTLWIATRKGLLRWMRGAAGWAPHDVHFLGDPVSQVLVDPRDGRVYAALNLGHFGCKLHRSDDGGGSWQEVAAPAYPVKPEGLQDDPHPWDLKLIWSLAAGGADEPGLLWAGTLPGGLFRSRDHGASWQLVESLWLRAERLAWGGGGYDWPGIHSVLVDPRASRRVTVGVSTGGVWQTEDGGASWAIRASGMRAAYMPPEQAFDENAQDPHRVVQCAGAPDTLWAQHHNGIFVSRDGARSWREIERAGPSTFGFAAAAHPRDPLTAWFVPAVKDERRVPVDGQLAVTRTRDGGTSFETLTRGLPAAPGYDLVYRHALVVDASGERLAMASTTGNAWLSESAGDAWRTLSNHLPPVAALAFG
ncbi:MAG TPA: exo-alpha-sialidase [Methylibium sp.]|uniref:WD40/YVTN/BNR-like repeat-containing protein n=1 Tax=Methylibium sp. TaxID=2067992 RepID=UPI002DB9DC7D|nr:exo-alpha-sialidase [Methylibium sp.]HEU4460539.1 exo-alpha-sialidase [Methylibium sp.]